MRHREAAEDRRGDPGQRQAPYDIWIARRSSRLAMTA